MVSNYSFFIFILTARSWRAIPNTTGVCSTKGLDTYCKVERDNRNKTTIKRTVGVYLKADILGRAVKRDEYHKNGIGLLEC